VSAGIGICLLLVIATMAVLALLPVDVGDLEQAHPDPTSSHADGVAACEDWAMRDD